MGRVWLARDEVLRRDVAIKEIALPFGLADDEREELRLRTLREARAAARLSHPNVVQIYDVQHGDERPWIVMEYVRSRSLLQVIKENGPLPVDQVAGIGLAILSALDAANRVGVLHRDVKPSNVLIADDGRVVLTDFGSAMIDEGEGALTRTGVILGSPQYIAPERVHKGTSTPESDLWSLGATLYDAVEGRPPYTRETTLGTLVALATEKPDPTHRAGALKPVINGLLQKNPHARMTAAEVEERLRRVADVQTTVHLRRVPEPRRPSDLGEVVRYEVSPAAAAAYAAMAESTAGPAVAAPTTATPAAAEARPLAATALPGGSARALPPPPRVHRKWLLAGSVVAAVALVSALVVFLPQSPLAGPDKSRDTTAGATPGAVPNALQAPAAAPTPSRVPPSGVSVGSAQTAPPAGFAWWKEGGAFQVAYPTGWTHDREQPAQMFFCAPGGPPTLRVRVWSPTGSGFKAALEQEEAQNRAKLPGYQRLSISGQAQSGSWEYTFRDPKAGPLHGMEQAFVAPNGRTYLIQWRTQPESWAANLGNFETVLRTFRAI